MWAMKMAGVRDGEAPKAARLFGLIFLLTIAAVLAKAAQQGIFLAAYPRERIPDAFIISALALAATSFVSSALAARLGPVRLLSALLIAAATLIFVGRFTLLGRSSGPMIIYVAVEASIGLLLGQTWPVVSEALDVRAAKRLLPLIGIASSLGWVIGGFGAGPLADAWSTASLLMVAGGAMVLSLAILRLILRIDLAGRATRGSKGVSLWAGARSGVASVVRIPLLRVLAVTSILGLLIGLLLDFQLFAVVQVRFDGDPERIAAFMGTFFGIAGAAGIIVQALLSGRVLTRMGGAKSSLSAPAIAVVASLAFLIAPVFFVAVFARGGYRVFKQSLASPARGQIQGVLPAVERSQSAALVNGVLAPLFFALGGLALKLLPADVDLRYLAVATIALGVVSFGIGQLWLGRAYVSALRRSMDRRRLDFGALQTESRLSTEHYELLGEELSDREDRAELAVVILATGDASMARPLLRQALSHNSARVRIPAIEALSRIGDDQDTEALAERVEQSDDNREQLAALTALATLGGPRMTAVMADQASADNPRIRALARAYLMNAPEPVPGLASSAASLESMLRSPDPAEREAAAGALVHVSVSEQSIRDAFRDLLDDEDPAVRRRAVAAAGHLGDRSFVRSFVHALADTETTDAAFTAFEAAGDDLTDAVAAALIDAPLVVYSRTAAALATGVGPQGENLLQRLLVHENPAVRYRAAQALGSRLRRSNKSLPLDGEVLAAVTTELSVGRQYRALLVGLLLPDGETRSNASQEQRVLQLEIEARIRQTEKRIFSHLRLAFDPRTIGAAERSLRSNDRKEQARALELLEHLVDRGPARDVLPFLEPRPLEDQRRELSTRSDVAMNLSDPLGRIRQLGDPHLLQCAIASESNTPNSYAINGREAVIPLVQRLYSLRQIPLFAELSGEDLMQVAKITEPESLAKHQIIFHKDDPGDVMYLIMRGRVSLVDGERELAVVGPNEFFGDLAVLDQEPRSATAVCVEDADVLTISKADLDELIERRAEIARQVIQVLTRRLRDTTKRLTLENA